MIDLSTHYMGLALKHPLIASASPLSRDLDGIRELEDAGAAAIVLFSLFEEQIRHENEAVEHLLATGAESFAESLSYFAELASYASGPDAYLDLLRRAREACDVPIIGSLNGVTSAGWTAYARDMEQAGASAIELNVYHVAADLDVSGAEVEDRLCAVARAVRDAVHIPLAVKTGPFFSSFGHMARRLVDAGANALVLFNRFYQPDFDLDTLEATPTLNLSDPREIRLPLLWIAVLHGRVGASLAATTGVHSHVQALKYLLAGADAVMMASALIKHGAGRLTQVFDDLQGWLAAHDYHSIEQLKGSMSHSHVADPSAFERANYVKILESYKNPYAF